jgi:hypothetical protein
VGGRCKGLGGQAAANVTSDFEMSSGATEPTDQSTLMLQDEIAVFSGAEISLKSPSSFLASALNFSKAAETSLYAALFAATFF